MVKTNNMTVRVRIRTGLESRWRLGHGLVSVTIRSSTSWVGMNTTLLEALSLGWICNKHTERRTDEHEHSRTTRKQQNVYVPL